MKMNQLLEDSEYGNSILRDAFQAFIWQLSQPWKAVGNFTWKTMGKKESTNTDIKKEAIQTPTLTPSSFKPLS